MLNAIIRFSLHHRLLVVALAMFMLGYGGWEASRLTIDLFPDLNRPRVTIMTEAEGMAPEEVETLITRPMERVLNGATGVQAVRSSSGVGISIVWVEFNWGTDVLNDRQIVNERLALVELPDGIKPQLAPISSITGQIMIIGMQSKSGTTSNMELRTLADWVVRQRLLNIEGVSQIFVIGGQRKQFQVLVNPEQLRRYDVSLHQVHEALKRSNANVTGGYLDDQGAKEYLVRGLGRVHSIEDLKKLPVKVSQKPPILLGQVARVIEGPQVKRGDSAAFVRRSLFRLVADHEQLAAHKLTLGQLGGAIARSDPRVTVTRAPGREKDELLVDSIGRIRSVEDLGALTLEDQAGRPFRLDEVAAVSNVEREPDSKLLPTQDEWFTGGPAVLLTVNKQPGADTRKLTDEVVEALRELERTLPDDVIIHPELYQQKAFIDLAISNVEEALLHGSLLVVVILFIFLVNFRTTFITLTAIPLSVVITALVFRWFGLSINTMTLGGLAVAIGELVDDAIVDVENIFRRLRENRLRPEPLHPLRVAYQASVEIRNSIVFATLIVVLVFIPLFGLSGMEGRLFTPLAVAYIVSILSSLLVSLTTTPVLAYWLLPRARAVIRDDEGPLLRGLKWLAGYAIRFSVRFPWPVLATAAAAVVLSLLVVAPPAMLRPMLARIGFPRLEQSFLPPFDEGVVQLNAILPPGTSLEKSKQASQQIGRRLQQIDGLKWFLTKTGRAELDEHAVGVHVTEVIGSFRADSGCSREEIIEEIRSAMKEEIRGVRITVEQPMAHLISHMLSGVQAQVAIKIFGNDLDLMLARAEEMERAIKDIKGVRDTMVEPQIRIPQLRIELNRDNLAFHGLTPGEVNELIETAMHGRVVSEVLVDERTFDLLVRFDEPFRENVPALSRLPLETPSGERITLDRVARIEVLEYGGPNTINRENVQRRLVLQCNVAGRGLVDVVREIQAAVKPVQDSLPHGYSVEFGGQFESQQSAARTIRVLFLVSLVGVFLVLYTMFRSVNFALQVMAASLTAFIGAVAALVITGQTLTVAAMVGFISLCGIASRNGILLLNHYLYLVRNEGEYFSRAMLIRAGRERLAPVLMTALTSGIGLVPLALAAGEPGKEILYPIATVIIGGLISSTLLEFLVRPALFWIFGRRAARRLVEKDAARIVID